MSISEQVKNKLTDRIVDWQEHSSSRVYITVRLKDIKETARILFRNLRLRFVTASGIDTPRGIEILYHFSYDRDGTMFSVKVLIEDKKNPQIESLATLFAGAEWIEREMWEMLGIKFIGHPNLKRLLLIDDWPEGEFPLRQEEH